MLRRVVQLVLGVVALWVILLAIASVAVEGRVAAGVTARLGESLGGRATAAAVDLALVRGALGLTGIAVRRSDAIGTLALDVAAVRCELRPLGLALLDRDCTALAIDGARFEVSAAALLRAPRPKRPPLHADRVQIREAALTSSPGAFAPGLGRVRVTVERAEAGATRFRTPLSWLFAVHELRATVSLPAGIAVQLTYRDGTLSAAGSLFGATPVAIPLTLPVREAADDAQAELQQLLALGRDAAERLIAQRARGLLRLGP
jgi:hypothetical protein